MSKQLNLLPEWTPQDGVLLAWPHALSDWLPFLPRIEQVFCELVFHIARFEHVVLLCNTPALVEAVHKKLTARGVNIQHVHMLTVPYNDTWLRDSGPITVTDGTHIYACDFR